MGYGNYSSAAHAALIAGRAAEPGVEVFTQHGVHPLMDPRGLRARESRDSADHPLSLPVVFALDVTGSMGGIPRMLATRELPTFMKLLTDTGVADPQLLFMAVGDATSDQAPLQVGQFESTAELMDQWLTRCYLEGRGGGSGEESYELVFYVLAQHMATDAWEKRRRKGYLFMTGDELPYPAVARRQIEQLLGESLDEDVPIEEAIAAAAEQWHLFFLIPDARRRGGEARWRDLLGDQVICLESADDTCAVAAGIVALTEGVVHDLDALAAVLKGQGMPRERIGSTVRALQAYAEVLDPAHPRRAHVPAGSASPSAWWKRLFG